MDLFVTQQRGSHLIWFTGQAGLEGLIPAQFVVDKYASNSHGNAAKM